MDDRKQMLFQQGVAKVEFLAGFRQALDFRYRHFCQSARADWERLFGKEPADSCVTVRIASATATRGAGFLKSRRPILKSTTKNSVPRFAH